jgi:hypothetical protein
MISVKYAKTGVLLCESTPVFTYFGILNLSQFGAVLGATTSQDVASATSGHARKKAYFTLARAGFRLIRSLHG